MTETSPSPGRTQSEIEMDDDVELIALRYVLSELTPLEEARFEERLEHDSNARDAVERAVDLTDALRGEGAASLSTNRRAPSTPLAMWIGAAALVAATVGIHLLNPVSSSSTDAERLIECWVVLGEDIQDVDVDALEEDATSDLWGTDEESQDEFPDWLWMAIDGEDR